MKKTYLFALGLVVAFSAFACSGGSSSAISTSCSVTQTSGGAKITCSDGSSATITNGVNGTNGTNGGGYTPAISGSRLTAKQYTWTGADGAIDLVNPGTFHDTTLNADCEPMIATDSTVRCLPANYGYGIGAYFADAACTEPAAFVTWPCGNPPYVYTSTTYDSCNGTQGATVYALSGTALANYYTTNGTTCTSHVPTAGEAFYALGAVVPPSTFVSFNGP